MLNELDDLVPDQLVDRLSCTQQLVPFEVFIYYLRHSEIGLAEKHLGPIFTTFYGRLETALRKTVSGAGLDQAVNIRKEIAERVVEMIAKDRDSQADSMYYWETNFNGALASLRTDVLRKHGPARETDPLINADPLDHEGGHGVSPEVDIAANDFINQNPSKLDDTAFRLSLMDAINGLPEDERRAVGLLLQGMQIESQDLEVMTIAKALACTDRTVRNRLKRAYEKLRIVLQAEDIQ
ncbi:sigma-70 family RNA polymerase sigma factor [Marinobacter sp. M3C]|uniref:RNA polymerase sigma factor n=1 Tax=Marinobacter sp. M3C TaxID=2917715 RepID=UPI00200F6C26|nr:sigma-70 family RNA polymerase sigma factor [Marinobacter sp. M3C]UQG60866.1 sigma-70 family RNA polymerase sigma factor [Marinobacter sp. M3C]